MSRLSTKAAGEKWESAKKGKGEKDGSVIGGEIMAKINVLDKEIAVCSQNDEDYICITDIARYKDPDRTDYIIQNWLRNRNTIEFLGIWEQPQ